MSIDLGIYGELGKRHGLVSGADRIKAVQAVPTILHGFNFASLVGGLPLARIHTMYGPSAHGKSAVSMAFTRSFLERGFPVMLIDAERTLEPDFVTSLLGRPPAEFPNLFAPDELMCYEDAVDAADRFITMLMGLRKEFGGEFGGLIVVDTINKLAPKGELKEMLSESVSEGDRTKANDKWAKGRQGQRRAAAHQMWMDRLTPMVAAANCAVLIIAQERYDDVQAGPKLLKIPRPKGGQCLFFDASMVIRVVREKGKEIKSGSDVVASRHRLEIHKSKVGRIPDGKFVAAPFFLGTGEGLAAAGEVDVWHDLVVTAVQEQVIERRGSHHRFGDTRLGASEALAVETVHNDPGLYEAIKTALYERESATRSIRRATLQDVNPETGEVGGE